MRADLAMLAHFVGREDDELDLAACALLLAEPEYPELRVDEYLAKLDDMADTIRIALDSDRHSDDPPVLRVARLLFENFHFRGNDESYYDPRNSFLNEVIDRRTGIPITLGVVILEISERLGLIAEGVSFPGHFLLRSDEISGPVFIDPFRAQQLSLDEIYDLYRVFKRSEKLDPRVLEPVGKREILIRMLSNLENIYRRDRDEIRLNRVTAQLGVLLPSASFLSDFGGISSSPSPRPLAN